MSQLHKLTVQVPAKLILSGEHAVVYGNPAIAMSVAKYLEITLAYNDNSLILFDFSNFKFKQELSITALKKLADKVQNSYQKFLCDRCTIKDVITHPAELLQYALSKILTEFGVILPRGLILQVKSDIPLGCGMGSSAAVIVGVLHSLNMFLKLGLTQEQYLQFGKEIENLQHGAASGFDIYLALHGGCHIFANGEFRSCAIPKFPMYMVNTGKPQSSTGECVAVAKKIFNKNKKLLNDFKVVTEDFIRAFALSSIRANHRLLVQIGVVPAKIQQFIAELEQHSLAAKICGAGACLGQQAGIVLVAGQYDDVKKVAIRYGFTVEKIIGARGVTVL